jgi:hypothetical protein
MLIVLFIVGYLAIAFEHQIKLNKAASAEQGMKRFSMI